MDTCDVRGVGWLYLVVAAGREPTSRRPWGKRGDFGGRGGVVAALGREGWGGVGWGGVWVGLAGYGTSPTPRRRWSLRESPVQSLPGVRLR